MTYSPRIADLAEALDTTAIHRALESAYARGFQDGKAALKRAIEALDDAGNLALPVGESPAMGAVEDGKRAPRGLTRRTITALLKKNGGMKMPDLQKAAAAADTRVLGKTVYNELIRERGRLYREQNDVWSLMGERPVEAANLHTEGQSDAAMAFDYFVPEQPEDKPPV